ncbi:MAG: hypothetical protein D6707_05330 [Bacteroidetes bacterium]|nr:MAG: hypothetical protein D6707_05330 [Bacteroidota bacterium]
MREKMDEQKMREIALKVIEWQISWGMHIPVDVVHGDAKAAEEMGLFSEELRVFAEEVYRRGLKMKRERE